MGSYYHPLPLERVALEELTLFEVVNRLPPNAKARTEYCDLRAQVSGLQRTVKRVQGLLKTMNRILEEKS